MTDFTFPATYYDEPNDWEFDVEISVRITSRGFPGRGPDFNSPGEPPESPEWEINGIDLELVDGPTPAEQFYDGEGLERLYKWAEDQVTGDAIDQALRDEAEAEAEYRAEQRRDRLD